MGGALQQLYIILWKDVYVNQIRRHVVWTLLELVFTAISMYGVGKGELELRLGGPVPTQAYYPDNFNTTYSRVGFLLPFASVVAKITDEKCSGIRKAPRDLTGGGVNWSNMNDYTSTLDNMSLSELLMVNVCTCLLMVFLIWYADNVIPRGSGIHKPPWFPFLKSYWMPQPARNVKIRQSADPTIFESDPHDPNLAIQVISLKKVRVG
ncbi:hypothetical protein HPB52_018854 [Rhipicephalus sanguineus]|uniref:Uncharacterized protein n=1 Tax=Rhipicephalus sanguineus TaxID=34632 RepID=A0A9D4PDJ4_RHISA|nr:hypothetical protein HPB52_018854 [Rhipicephalus sanguineus]